jgi:hypothetical protein
LGRKRRLCRDETLFVDWGKGAFAGLKSVERHQRDPVIVDERSGDDEAVENLVAVKLK